MIFRVLYIPGGFLAGFLHGQQYHQFHSNFDGILLELSNLTSPISTILGIFGCLTAEKWPADHHHHHTPTTSTRRGAKKLRTALGVPSFFICYGTFQRECWWKDSGFRWWEKLLLKKSTNLEQPPKVKMWEYVQNTNFTNFLEFHFGARHSVILFRPIMAVFSIRSPCLCQISIQAPP